MITGPNNTNSTSSSGVSKYAAESKASKAGNATAAVVTAQSEAVAAASTAPANTVSLSKEAKMMQKLAQEISTYPSVDADRVAEIKSEIANGGYNINSGVIAQKMMLLDSLYK